MSRKGGIGWFLGLLAGTALGVFFAPKEGKELRKNIKKVRSQGKIGHEPVLDALKDMGKDICDTAVDLYEDSSLEEVVEMGKKEVVDFNKKKIRPFVDEIKETVEDGFDTAKHEVKKAHKKAKSIHRIIHGNNKKQS